MKNVPSNCQIQSDKFKIWVDIIVEDGIQFVMSDQKSEWLDRKMVWKFYGRMSISLEDAISLVSDTRYVISPNKFLVLRFRFS